MISLIGLIQILILLPKIIILWAREKENSIAYVANRSQLAVFPRQVVAEIRSLCLLLNVT